MRLWLPLERVLTLFGGGLVGGLCWYAPDLLNLGIFWPMFSALSGGVLAALFFSRSINYYHFGIISCVILVFLLRLDDLLGALLPVSLSYFAVLLVSYTGALVTDYIRQIIRIRKA